MARFDQREFTMPHVSIFCNKNRTPYYFQKERRGALGSGKNQAPYGGGDM
jgi:hypothetical protein